MPVYVKGQVSDSANLNLEVTGTCNSNGICEPDLGEDTQNCPSDCVPIITFTLTYSATEGGTITGSISQTVNKGSDGSQVTAVANNGYHFTGWSDGLTTASRTDTNIQGNISLTASFVVNSEPPPTTFTLTYSATEGGTITGSISQTVNKGSDGSQVTAVANNGYHFTGWSDGLTTASRTDTNIQGNISLTASFVVNSTIIGGGSVLIPFQIKDLVIGSITTNSVNISWATNQFSSCQFFWGKTSEYEKEVISETTPATGHVIRLKNLDFSNIYHFKIVCTDSGLEKDQIQDKKFQTLTPLSNVVNFIAVTGDGKITLGWTNPADANFNGVKILRSTIFYPLNIKDGTTIYEGFSNSFEDINLVNGTTYYYTIFATDNSNSYSSGAITSATPSKKNIEPTVPVLPVKPASPESKKVTINDFKFSAGTTNLPIENNKTIEVPNSQFLNISADCDKLSDAKTVLVNLQDNQKISSFILKQEGAKNSCNVSLVLPQRAGNYSLKILIINSKNEIIGQIEANLKVLAKNAGTLWFGSAMAIRIYILAILVMIFFMIWFSTRKRRGSNIRLGF